MSPPFHRTFYRIPHQQYQCDSANHGPGHR